MKIKKCGREVKVGGAGHAAREMVWQGGPAHNFSKQFNATFWRVETLEDRTIPAEAIYGNSTKKSFANKY